MPRQSFQNLPPERRREILDVAVEEFAASGFGGTSYNKLLERLGLGKSSAYYYFENKRDLFLTAVADCYARYFERVSVHEEPRMPGEFWCFVEASAREGFDFMLDDPAASALMRCFQREPSLLAEFGSDELLVGMAAFYEAWVRLGQSLGAVRDDLPLALLVETARSTTLAFDQWFIAETGRSPVDVGWLSERYTDAMRRLLEPCQPGGLLPSPRSRPE